MSQRLDPTDVGLSSTSTRLAASSHAGFFGGMGGLGPTCHRRRVWRNPDPQALNRPHLLALMASPVRPR